MKKKRVLLVSDTHNCHIDLYGVSTKERMDRLMRHIQEEYQKDPFEMILFLGDYSLDHWRWQIQGSWLKEGRSYTDEWIKAYFDQLPPVPYYMIAGNHEQYGEEKWREITGCSRSLHVVMDDYLFILLDGYGANLDPEEHSDGTYAPMDVQKVRAIMDQYPDKKVILGSHYFHPDLESDKDGVKAILCDERVICLFAGHTHKADVWTLSEEYGSKKVIFTGNYSYCGGGKDPDPRPYMWGFRDLYLDEHSLLSRYIVQENDVVIQNEAVKIPYAYIEEVKMEY